MKNLMSFFAILAVMTCVVFGQTVGATVEGTVRDASGAVLPGVQIAVKNIGTGTTNETISDERGSYRIPLLQPGDYELEASLPGFNTVSRRGIRLTVGQTALIDF